MPRFAANLSMMFQEVPFLERFGAAAAAGFQGVEYLFPYEHPAEAIAAELEKHRLQNVLFNTPAGDWSQGERGLACLPDRTQEFRDGVRLAIEYAEKLGTRQLHAMAGLASSSFTVEEMQATYAANIRYAASQCAEHGLVLLIEAINTRDIPGFFLTTQQQSHAVVEEIGAPNLKMQMDCYHMQIMEGDLTAKLKQYAALCGHVQVASVPGRNEPDRGEVNYSYVFDLLDSMGYDGWVGCEYRPAGATVDGLGWLRAMQSRD